MRAYVEKFLKKKIPYFAIDIGSTSIKFLELEFDSATPRISRCGFFPLQGDVFSGHTLSNAQKVVEALAEGLAEFDPTNKRAATAVPGPSVFTKRIKVPKMPPQELASHIELEAGNFLPQNLNAVRIDFHVLEEIEKGQLEVLVVAAKGDIVESFSDCLTMAGYTPGVVDVDYFSLQNIFELNYPEHADKNVVIVNIGARFSAVNISKGGETLFTGDVSVGGKQLTEALANTLGCSFDEAEKIKKSSWENHPQLKEITRCVEEYVTNAAAELHRQLSFFWNATGSDEGIDLIFLAGGGALTPGFGDALAERTDIECEYLDPFRRIDNSQAEIFGEKIDDPVFFAVAAGLSLRKHRDKGAA